jgi:membrane protein DedA with SNARE-associated domain
VDDILSRLLALITDNTALAGPAIGLLALAESLIVIGMVVPATALMIAVGGLIAAGILDPIPVLLWAILGDWLSYLLGRWIGPSVYRRWPLCNHRQGIAYARLFFRRHGFVSIFLGRFFGPVRACIPLVGGVMQMDHRSFQMANVLSAIVWVPAMLLPGYLAGGSLPLEMLSGWQVPGIGIALVVVPFLAAASISRIALSRRHKRQPRRKTIFGK